VLPQHPQLTGLRNGRTIGKRRKDLVLGRRRLLDGEVVDQAVGLGNGEAGRPDGEGGIQNHQALEFESQQLFVPARIQRQLVVSDDVDAVNSLKAD
jgi:hypothetical protein